MCRCGCKAGRLGAPCSNPNVYSTGQDGNSAVTLGEKPPDTMRHGGFYWEVVGDDHARDDSQVSRDVSRERYSPTRTNPATNQAGMLAPLTSARGQRLLAAAGGIFIREMNPIEYAHRFGNNVGATTNRTARNIPVVAQDGYGGILPLNQQPVIDKPLPY